MKRYFLLPSRLIILISALIFNMAAWCQEDQSQIINLIPRPRQVIPGNGNFKTGNNLKIYINKKAGDETRFSFGELRNELSNSRVKETSHAGKADVVIGIISRDKPLAKAISLKKLELPDEAKEEGYIIDVSTEKIMVAAETEAGLFYGIQTLKQLIRTNSDTIPSMTIIDWPSLKYRGWMDDISRGPIPTISFLKECIRKMAEFKQNYFTLYTEHVFKLKNYPDIAPPDGLTTEEIKELTEFAAKYHIDLVGNFQSFGHMAKILSNPFYTYLGENNDILNPAEESTYTFLSNIYSEIVPTYKSAFFNINCDETFGLGEGKSKALAEEIGIDGIYASHINRIDQLIKPYGKRIMMWGDIAVNNPGIINKLPKDLVILSWGYHAAESFDDAILPFKNTGFDFMVAPGVSCWNELWPGMSNAVINISNYTRDGYKLGAIGMMNTAWDDNGHNLFNSNWHGLIWGAECSWSPCKETAGEQAVIERNKKLAEFNKAFDKLFFDTENVTQVLMAIDSLRNFPVPGILNEWAFWNNINDFNSYNTSQTFVEQNRRIISITDSLTRELLKCLNLIDQKHVYRYSYIGKGRPKSSEMIDNALFALQRIAFTADKNITRALLFEIKETGDKELIAKAQTKINYLKEQLFKIKKRYVALWERENRSWWLDKNLDDYNKLFTDINKAGTKIFIETSPKLYNGNLLVNMKNLFGEGNIVYTTDGTEPDRNSAVFHNSLQLSNSALIKARTIHDDETGPVSEKYIAYHKGIGCLKQLHSSYSKYNPAYSAGGINGLLDGLKGSARFNDGRWQGYQDQDLDMEIDLQTVTDISSISVDFIQNSYSWILLPKDVEIQVSEDGSNYKTLQIINHDLPQIINKAFIHTFTSTFKPFQTRN